MSLVSRSLQSSLLLVAVAVLLLSGLSGPVRAADDASPAAQQTPAEQIKEVWTRDLLTGDWEGWRTALQDHGIDPQFRLSQYGQWVADGGVETNGAYGGTLDYRLNFDLRKLFGMWDGLSVNMHARTRFGDDVLADAGGMTLPNTGLLMPLPGNHDRTDVTGLLLNQTFPLFAGREALFSIGKIDILDAVTLFFPSVAYGQEGFWNVHSLVTALPWFGAVEGLSLYGGWLASINEEYQMGESAILVTGTENVTTSWSSVQDSFDDGAWIAAFHRFFWKLDDKAGYFMVFAGGSTRDQASTDPNDFVIKPGQGIVSTKEEKPWDVALYLSQAFWQAEADPTRKATILIGGTVGPDDPQFAQYSFFTALQAYGPMASRPADRMGVSFWYNWLSDDFKDLVSPVDNLRDLYGFELYYNVAINKWLHLTPDLQLIKNEFNGDDLAIIPGVRAVIDF
jgi:carbohydrate-selective porin OprB